MGSQFGVLTGAPAALPQLPNIDRKLGSETPNAVSFDFTSSGEIRKLSDVVAAEDAMAGGTIAETTKAKPTASVDFRTSEWPAANALRFISVYKPLYATRVCTQPRFFNRQLSAHPLLTLL